MQQIIGIVLALALGFLGGSYFQSMDKHDHEHGGDEHAMMHEMLVEASSPAPTLDVVVHKDPMSGYNVELLTTNFRFAPENASLEHVPGEGHGHIYVDGTKINRLYGNWYHLGKLEEGQREIKVSLSANNHGIYAVNGEEIAVTKVITVGDDAMEMEQMSMEDAREISVSISGRKLSPEIVEVTEGEHVVFKVTTDEAGEFHIAGYEVKKMMNADVVTDVMLMANSAGRYNLELHPMDGEHSDHSDGEHEDIVIGALVVNPS